MTNIEIIKYKLSKPNSYTLLPMCHTSTPLPFPEWEIQVEEINEETGEVELIDTGEYYSAENLSKELGNFLVLFPKIDGNFFMMRYGTDWDTIPQLITFFETLSVTIQDEELPLFDVRKKDDGTLAPILELDFSEFIGNEFIISPMHMVDGIPD